MPHATLRAIDSTNLEDLDLSSVIAVRAVDIPFDPVMRDRFLAVIGRLDADCVVFIGPPGPRGSVSDGVLETGRRAYLLHESDPLVGRLPLAKVGVMLAGWDGEQLQ